MQTEQPKRPMRVLLIWQARRNKYYRIESITPKQLDWLRHSHGTFIDPNALQRDEIVMKLANLIGIDYGVDFDESFGSWSQYEMPEERIVNFMGWDRVVVTGLVSEKNLH